MEISRELKNRLSSHKSNYPKIIKENVKNLNITKNIPSELQSKSIQNFQLEGLENILASLNLKINNQNLNIANSLLTNSFPVTKENFQVLNQCLKLFEKNGIEKGIFFLKNEVKPTQNLAKQIDSYLNEEINLNNQIIDTFKNICQNKELLNNLDIFISEDISLKELQTLNNNLIELNKEFLNFFKNNNILEEKFIVNNFKSQSNLSNTLIENNFKTENTLKNDFRIENNNKTENISEKLPIQSKNKDLLSNVIIKIIKELTSFEILFKSPKLLKELELISKCNLEFNKNIKEDASLTDNVQINKSDKKIFQSLNLSELNISDNEIIEYLEYNFSKLLDKPKTIDNNKTVLDNNFIKKEITSILKNLDYSNKLEINTLDIKLNDFKYFINKINKDFNLSTKFLENLTKVINFNKKIVENLTFDFINSSPNKLNKFFNKIKQKSKALEDSLEIEILKNKTLNKDNNINENILNSIKGINKNLEFMSCLKDTIYYQIPLNLNNEIKQSELFIFKDKQKRNKTSSNKDGSALISLDLSSLGHLEAFVTKTGKNVTCQFRMSNKTSEKIVKNNLSLLNKYLKDKDFNLTNTSFKEIKEKFTIISKMEEKSKKIKISSFNTQA